MAYNLACAFALSATGSADRPVPAAEEAARLRDLAFARLEDALALGWSDRAHLERDADLAILHDDPRWTEILARCRR